MSLIASAVMGTCGAVYILLGSCMLISASTKYRKHLGGILLDVSGLYPSLFKCFDSPPAAPHKAAGLPPVDDDGEGSSYYHHGGDEGGRGGGGLYTVGEEELGYEASAADGSIQERLLLRDDGRLDGETVVDSTRGVALRLLAYLLLLFGLCRLISAFYFGCGYVYLGMASCIIEIGIVSTELLQHKSMRLHGAMGILLELGILSEIYLGTAIPYCHV